MQPTPPVLVVDDSATMRAIIIKFLNALGFTEIDVAEDGNAALLRLQERQYGLLISDWEMQPMGGEELLKKLRQNPQSAKLPVIMATTTANRGASWLVGANAFLSKPFTEGDLQKAIKAACGI
jgi:two-component system chemotaxis response regulator CheY